jgi:hypothetical protein
MRQANAISATVGKLAERRILDRAFYPAVSSETIRDACRTSAAVAQAGG